METVFGKVLSDLTRLATKKWYSAMGMTGLLVIMWVMLFGTPHDDVLIGLIGAAMMCIGFGEAETRTFRHSISVDGQVKLTTPVRQATFVGVLLYLLGLTAIGAAIWRVVSA